MSIGNPKTATGYTTHNKVKLVRGGRPYFELLIQLINKAKENIHLQSYIYDHDETGKLVTDALKAAASRGIHVYLMADGYASQVMSQKFIDELKIAGIHFRYFEPLFKSRYFYFGRRMHHKMVVVDSLYSLVGGINIANRYNDMPGKSAWLDFAIYAEGEIAKELCVLCWKTWKGYPAKMGLTPCEEKQINYHIPEQESSKVRMRRNDWVRRKNQISRTYLEMFRNAKSHVTILCSYFLPGNTFRKAILAAKKRGIKIKVLVAGPSDVMLAKNAERFMYAWLLRNKIELYEYQGKILHGKIAVCDDEWITAGSYNINDISAYASIELNLDVSNPVFAKDVTSILEKIIANDCKQITTATFKENKNIFKQFIYWFSYQLIRVVLYLFTFYFKQRD